MLAEMQPGSGFAQWMAGIQARTERALDAALPPANIAPQRLHAAMRHAALGAGKRVRPLLVHAAGALTGAPADRLDCAACAVELIHAYSLVHDDLPCMDDDTLRRGRPTCHVRYGEATALLAGDALQSLAFHALVDARACGDAGTQVELVRLLAQAAGSRGMAGGQAIDLASVGTTLTAEELEFMHIHKTGALIRAAVAMGARLGTALAAAASAALDRYAKCAGLLFQVVDDILDCESDTATLGKTAGKDRDRNKPTYVTVLGLARARELSAELREEAMRALDPLGAPAGRLRELAQFIVERTF